MNKDKHIQNSAFDSYEQLSQGTLSPEEEALFVDSFFASLDEDTEDSDPEDTAQILSEHISRLAKSDEIRIAPSIWKKAWIGVAASVSIIALIAGCWFMLHNYTESVDSEDIMAAVDINTDILLPAMLPTPDTIVANDDKHIGDAHSIGTGAKKKKSTSATKHNSEQNIASEPQDDFYTLLASDISAGSGTIEEIIKNIDTTIDTDDACMLCLLDSLESDLTTIVEMLKASEEENWAVVTPETNLRSLDTFKE